MGAATSTEAAAPAAGSLGLPGTAKQIQAAPIDDMSPSLAVPAPVVLDEDAPAFPMHVVRIADVLAVLSRDGPLPCFEDLEAEGKLVTKSLDDTENTIFFSHTWLGYQHPDPAGEKMRLLHDLLKNIQSGTQKVKGYGISAMNFKGLTITAAQMKKDCADATIWLDYFCIPQRDKIKQLAAIGSITEYVARCSMFIVLSGAWTHQDGSIRDQRAWFGRGWCRMEQLANALSPTVKPLIIAETTSCVINYGPLGHQGHAGWWAMPVGRGAFTVDSDKIALGAVIAKLIERRKAQSLREGDLLWYRHLTVLEASILAGTGYPVTHEPLDAWLTKMHFESVAGDRASTKYGLTPLYYAVMSCRPDLVGMLLDHGANIASRIPKATKAMLDHWTLMPTMTLLVNAIMGSYAHDDASCVKLLLERGADPRLKMQLMGSPLNALWFAAGSNCVETCKLIYEAAPELAQQPFLMMNNFPFECGVVCSRTSVKWVLENHPDELMRDRPGPLHGGKHRVAGQAVFHVGSVETLRMVLDAGADPNGYPVGAKVFGHPVMRLAGYFLAKRAVKRRDPSDTADQMGLGNPDLGVSPLHIACQRGNIGAVRLLIERGARVASTSAPYRMTPLMFAAMRGHEKIVEELLSAAQTAGLSAPALISAKDKRGKTAEFYANLRGEMQVVELLRSRASAVERAATPVGDEAAPAALEEEESMARARALQEDS